jgi:hypothetical protein
MNARRWWHVTNDWHGAEWVARRIRPTGAPLGEPKTPRLCVSSWLAGALAARWTFEGRDIHCYLTEQRRTVPARGVWDAVITGERWVIPPAKLTHVLTIPAAAMAWRQPHAAMIRLTGATPLLRAQELVRCCQVVREACSEFRSRACEEFAAGCVKLSAEHQLRRDNERYEAMGMAFEDEEVAA